jgi:hypothetical protein
MVRPAWTLARAWPKTFFFGLGKKKKIEKENRKKGKMDNLKTAFTLFLSLFLARQRQHTDTVTPPPVPCLVRPPPFTTPPVTTPQSSHRQRV